MQKTNFVNLYFSRYIKLIDAFRNKTVDNYERHHIIPRCLGGTDEDSNIICLPPKAHFIAHYLLSKAYPNNDRLNHAFAMMIVNNPYQDRKFTGILYEKAKLARSKALKGKPRPEWVKAKLRKPKSNKENYHKPKSEKHRHSMSLAQKGRTHRIDTCIHCGKTGSAPNISRWHNDKCKFTCQL